VDGGLAPHLLARKLDATLIDEAAAKVVPLRSA
jgi:hypothetical protein